MFMNDDDDDDDYTDLEELGATLPQTGWHESADGTLCTYRAETDNPYSPFVDYLAISVKNGICTGCTYNMMFDSEAEAEAFYNAMMNDVDEYSTRTTFRLRFKRSGKRIYNTFIEDLLEDNISLSKMRQAVNVWWIYEHVDNSTFGPGMELYDTFLRYEESAPWYLHWDGSYGSFSIQSSFGSQSLLIRLSYSMSINDNIGEAVFAEEFENPAYAQEIYEEMLYQYTHREPDDLVPYPTINGNTITCTYRFSHNIKIEDAYMLHSSNAEEFKVWIRAFIFFIAYEIVNPRMWF